MNQVINNLNQYEKNAVSDFLYMLNNIYLYTMLSDNVRDIIKSNIYKSTDTQDIVIDFVSSVMVILKSDYNIEINNELIKPLFNMSKDSFFDKEILEYIKPSNVSEFYIMIVLIKLSIDEKHLAIKKVIKERE